MYPCDSSHTSSLLPPFPSSMSSPAYATHIEQVVSVIGRGVLPQSVGQLGVRRLRVIRVGGLNLQTGAVGERHGHALGGVLGQLEGEVVLWGGDGRSVVLVLDAHLGREVRGDLKGGTGPTGKGVRR